MNLLEYPGVLICVTSETENISVILNKQFINVIERFVLQNQRIRVIFRILAVENLQFIGYM